MQGNSVQRISPMRELLLLINEGYYVLIGETRNLVISLLFPVAAMLVTVWIAGEEMFVNCESTKSACFVLICAAIWGGLFNSIQVVVKERDNVRRDYVSGALRLGCYTASRAFIQLVLCAIQSVVLCLSFYGIEYFYENDLPSAGLVFDTVIIELYITLFLVMYAADAMGLMLSCCVRSEQLASMISPYILIVQLLFSTVLFPMKGLGKTVSNFMLSRWGMEALGSTCDLNGLPLKIQSEIPTVPHEVEEAYEYLAEHVTDVWLVLLLFIAVPLIAGNFILHGIKNDRR